MSLDACTTPQRGVLCFKTLLVSVAQLYARKYLHGERRMVNSKVSSKGAQGVTMPGR